MSKPICDLSKIQFHLSGLRSDKLHEHCQKYFNSQEVMEAVKHICNAIVKSTHLSSNDRFREYIRSEISNLSETEFDSATIRHSTDGVFVIKSYPEHEEDLEREKYLCDNYLNHFRGITPIFRYFFGTVNCSPVLSDGNKINVCPSEGSNQCIIELIEGITYKQFIKSCNFDEFIRMFILLIISLNETKYFQLTLHNCDGDNIMIRDLEEPIIFNIETDKENYKIVSRFIPIIMNYDKARYIKTNGKINYYSEKLKHYDELEDAFNLIKNTVELAKDINRPLYDNIKLILNWFKNSTNLTKLIDFCYSLKGRDSELGYSGPVSKQLCDELNYLGMLSYGDKLSFIEYYDLKDYDHKNAINNFDYNEALIKEKNLLEKLMDDLEHKVEIDLFDLDRLTNPVYFKRFKLNASDFLIYLGLYHRLKLHYDVGMEIIEEFKNKDLSLYIKNKKYYDIVKEFLESHRTSLLKSNSRIDRNIEDLDEIENTVNWYEQGIILLKTAIERESF